MQPVTDEPTEITRMAKVRECWVVEGYVRRGGRWLKASFTAHASDIEHMPRPEFEAFARRQLPHMTEDVDWRAQTV